MSNHKYKSVHQLDKAYWDDQYQLSKTGWEIGYASPALTHYIDQLQDKSIAILIPGCGQGHEAQYLIDKGFTNITVVDISLFAVEQLRARFELSPEINIIHADFFTLEGEFDLILEQTFFCAIDPVLRQQYVSKTSSLLKPTAKLVGVLFNRTFEQSTPPYGGDQKQYQELFSKHYNIVTLEPCYNSIAPRQGSELFIIATSIH